VGSNSGQGGARPGDSDATSGSTDLSTRIFSRIPFEALTDQCFGVDEPTERELRESADLDAIGGSTVMG